MQLITLLVGEKIVKIFLKNHRHLGKAYEDLDYTVVIAIQRYNNCSEIHHGCRV